MGGGGKKPPRPHSGIWPPAVIKLGMLILWGKNFPNLAKQFTRHNIVKYDVISDCHCVATAKNVCN